MQSTCKNSIINREPFKPVLFSSTHTQEHAASSRCAHVWQESTSSYPAILATCMASLKTLAMAMAGPCFVPGEASVSHCWLASSAPWLHPWVRLPLAQPSTSRGRRTEPCDRGVVKRLNHRTHKHTLPTLMFNSETVFVWSPSHNTLSIAIPLQCSVCLSCDRRNKVTANFTHLILKIPEGPP